MVVITMVMFLVSVLSLNSIGLLSFLAFAQNSNKLFITDGIASGDVTNNSAIIWSRTNAQALMHVQYDTNSSFSHAKSSKTPLVDNSTDFAGHIKLDSLSPDTLYYYRVWFSPASDNMSDSSKGSLSSDTKTGSFRTARDHITSIGGTKDRTISFVIGGDLGGQNYCRRDGTGGIEGYPIFSIMQSLSPDFFIFNGDQIYGDNACSANGPSNVTGWKNIEGNFRSATDKKVSNATTRYLQQTLGI